MRAWLLPLLSLGCSANSVKAELNGEKVTTRDAYFVEHLHAYGDNDHLISIAMASVPKLCKRASEFYRVDALARDPEESAEAWAEQFPETFWSVGILLRVSDLEALEETEFEGYELDHGELRPDGAFASIDQFLRPLDADYFSADAPQEDYANEWYSQAGSLTISKYRDGDLIKGEFETNMVDASTNEGSTPATISFRAKRCTPVESYQK